MKEKYDYTIFIGRFQPPHRAHIQIIEQALEYTENVIVLIGSSNQPRTIKNPWSYEERRAMIYDSLPDSVYSRVITSPIRDILYNDQQWVCQVQNTVDRIVKNTTTNENVKIGLIGHSKDETSYYLSFFPQWKTIDVDLIDDLHASDIRDMYFNTERDEMDFDSQISHHLPPGIHNHLKAFELTPEYEQLVREYAFINAYKQAWDCAPYEPTFVTVDAVVIQSGHILLVRRRAEPGRGLWALPGGFLNPQERIQNAVIRELREETKIKVPVPVLAGSIKAKDVYDHPRRSLRGRTITHAFLIELQPGPLPKVKGSDDADKAKWIPLSTFENMEDQMFEDHFHIINDMLGKL